MSIQNNLRSPFLFLAGIAFITMSFSLIKEEFSYSENIDLKNIKHLTADISFTHGTFHLSTHDQQIAEFKSVYNNPAWKAELKLDPKNELLTIRNPKEDANTQKKNKNEWNIKIPAGLSTDLKLNVGAGAADIDLSNTKISTLSLQGGAGAFNINLANTSLSVLTVNIGAGGLQLDLSGNHTKPLNAKIVSGAGGLKLDLPRVSGVRVKVRGLSIVSRGDLKKQDGYYVNDLYGKSENNMEIEVESGVGGVQLRLK